MTRVSDPWIELRDDGKLWAKYHPGLKLLEIAKGKVKVIFDLKLYEAEMLRSTQSLQEAPRDY